MKANLFFDNIEPVFLVYLHLHIGVIRGCRDLHASVFRISQRNKHMALTSCLEMKYPGMIPNKPGWDERSRRAAGITHVIVESACSLQYSRSSWTSPLLCIVLNVQGAGRNKHVYIVEASWTWTSKNISLCTKLVKECRPRWHHDPFLAQEYVGFWSFKGMWKMIVSSMLFSLEGQYGQEDYCSRR